jgi:hypothetical protein
MEKESEQQDIPVIVEPAEESPEKRDEDESESEEEEEDHLPIPPPSSKRMSIRWNPTGASGRMSVEKNTMKLNPPVEEREDTKSVRSIRFEEHENHRSSIASHPNNIQEEDDEDEDSDSDDYVPPPNFPGVRKTSLMWAPPGFESSQSSIGRRMSTDFASNPQRRGSLRETDGSSNRRNSSVPQDAITSSKLSALGNDLQNQQPSILEIGKRSTTTSPEGKEPLKGSRSSGYQVPLEAKVTRRKQSLSQNELNRSKDQFKGSLMDLATESAKGSTTLKRMAYYSPFVQWFFDASVRLNELYYEHITFKMECVLQLFVLLPFVLLALILYYMDVAIMPDLYIELLLKVCLVIIGQLAEYSVSIVNQRHAEITCMAKIVTNQATARDVFETIAGKRVNKILKYSGILH